MVKPYLSSGWKIIQEYWHDYRGKKYFSRNIRLSTTPLCILIQHIANMFGVVRTTPDLNSFLFCTRMRYDLI